MPSGELVAGTEHLEVLALYLYLASRRSQLHRNASTVLPLGDGFQHFAPQAIRGVAGQALQLYSGTSKYFDCQSLHLSFELE